LVNGAAGYYYVISVAERDLTVLGFEGAFSFVDKEDLIGIGVFVKYIVSEAFCGRCECELDIVIEQDRFPAFEIISIRGNFKTLETTVFKNVLSGGNGCYIEPSVLKSCSEYKEPSGFRNCVWRLGGIFPNE